MIGPALPSSPLSRWSLVGDLAVPLLVAALAVCVVIFWLRSVRRHGIWSFWPLVVALLLPAGCFSGFGPAGGPFFEPKLSMASASATATVSAPDSPALTAALRSLDSYLARWGLGPEAEARTRRQLSWWSPPPLSQIAGNRQWWADNYASWTTWSYRLMVPCEMTRRYNQVDTFEDDRTPKFSAELVAAGAWQDGCWPLGASVPNPQDKGSAAEENHRMSPVFEKAQCHGLGVYAALSELAARGHVVGRFLGSGGRIDERLSLLPDCKLTTLAQAVNRAAAAPPGDNAKPPPPATPACNLAGRHAEPVDRSTCTTVQPADGTGCCWSDSFSWTAGATRRCWDNPDCFLGEDPEPPPATCPDGTCDAGERISGDCPADCPPPAEPPPPTKDPGACSESVQTLLDLLLATDAAARQVERACRP